MIASATRKPKKGHFLDRLVLFVLGASFVGVVGIMFWPTRVLNPLKYWKAREQAILEELQTNERETRDLEKRYVVFQYLFPEVQVFALKYLALTGHEPDRVKLWVEKGILVGSRESGMESEDGPGSGEKGPYHSISELVNDFMNSRDALRLILAERRMESQTLGEKLREARLKIQANERRSKR
jgi:hypothetical protein